MLPIPTVAFGLSKFIDLTGLIRPRLKPLPHLPSASHLTSDNALVVGLGLSADATLDPRLCTFVLRTRDILGARTACQLLWG